MADEKKTRINDTESGGASGTKSQPQKAPQKPTRKPLPPWKLILHNDDVNTFEDVIHIIHLLTPLSEQEATVRTLEAHENGVALLLVTHQERAELYVEQFASCKLTATAEPDV